MTTTTQIFQIAPRNNANGTTTTATRVVPTGFDSATVQINATTGNPATPFSGFAHPFSISSMAITFGINWSWDAGVTFPGATSGTQNGIATGIWATDKLGNPILTPNVTLGIPFDLNLGGSPNAYQAFMLVAGGPITFGLTVLETTG